MNDIFVLVGAFASAFFSAFASTLNPLSGALARFGGDSGTTRLQSAAASACAVLLAAGVLAPTAAHAQSVNFAGTQTTLASGFARPVGIAVDASGNVYVADTNNSEVKEILAVNGVIPANPTVNVLGSGFAYPAGVAVDASGDVFVADTNNSKVKEIVAVNGSIPASNPTINTLGSGFSSPAGVAVDASGNVYVADTSNFEVKEILAVNGVIPASPTINVLGGYPDFYYPYALALDASGDLFVANHSGGTVVEVLAVAGVIPAKPTINTVASGFINPQGLAVDAAGNLYVGNYSDDQLDEVLAVGGAIPSTPVINVLGTGLSYPSGVAVGPNGKLYVDDTVNNQVVELQLGAVNIGSSNIATAATPVTLNYNAPASITIGSVNVFTDGAPNLDFTLDSSSTCSGTVSTYYGLPGSCTVVVDFNPKYAGVRTGAVQITDTSGNVLVTTPIYGSGTGPQAAFLPGTPSAVPATGLKDPTGAAVDGAGNVYIADPVYNAIVKVTPQGVQTTIDTSIVSPVAIALDGAGNLYVTGGGGGEPASLYEIPAGTDAPVALQTGYSTPYGLAVDSAGNIYVSDFAASAVYKVAPGGATQTTIGTGFQKPVGLAVDAAGNLYVADYGVKGIVKIATDGTQTTVASGITPSAVAVDAAGDLFATVADSSSTVALIAIPAGGGTPSTLLAGLPVGAVPPLNIAISGGGDLYFANFGDDYVFKVQLSQPPTLAFASTNVGATSSDSPKSVLVQNIGNATLTGSGLTAPVGGSFSLIDGTGTPPDCVSSPSLAPGAQCDLSFEFSPQSSGPLTASATITDNSLNTVGATQTIGLSGTGVAPKPPLAQLSSSTVNFGTTAFLAGATQTVKVTNIGGGVLTLSPSVNGPSVNASLSLGGGTCGAGVAAGQSCTLTIQYTPSTVGVHTNVVTIATNGATTPTIATTGSSTGVGATSNNQDFATIPVGTTETLPVTITNYHVSAKTTLSFSISGPSYTIANNGCTAGLTNNQNCTVTVKFKPTSAGSHTNVLTVTASNGNVSTVNLKGTATAAP